MKKIILAFIVGALAACGPSPADIQRAIEQTQAAQPTSTPLPTSTPPPTETPTPTPIPFADLDIEALIIQPGDLPAGLSGGQIRDTAGEKMNSAPDADQVVFQLLEDKGESAGSVTVMLYEDLANAQAAYQVLAAGMADADPTPDVGEEALLWTFSATVLDMKVESGELGFLRCGAVVDIVMGTSDGDVLTAYGKRLDARLTEAICR